MPYTLRRGQRVVAFATRQYQQEWQVRCTSRKVTRSPSRRARPSTSRSGPRILSSLPTETCPGTSGYGTPSSLPACSDTSVPQTSLSSTRRRAAPVSRAGSLISRTSIGAPGAGMTATRSWPMARSSEIDGGHGDRGEGRVPLDDPIDAIQGRVAEHLGRPGRGPANLDRIDGGGAAQSDLLLQAVPPEAAARAARGIDVARTGRCRDAHLEAAAYRRSVRPPPLQPEGDEMAPVSGIHEQDGRGHVALEPATHLLEDVLVAVVVDVAERHAVPLLEIADVGREGDVLEGFPLGVAEQPVRDQGTQGRLAVAEIDVGPAVVVEIAEVRSHRQ